MMYGLLVMIYSMSFGLLMSTFFVVSNFLMMWMVLELKLYFFMTLMNSQFGKNYPIMWKGLSPSLVYFVFQSIGSVLMITGMNFKFTPFLISLGLLLKLGLLPFFWWLPYISIYLNWMNFGILLTVNKAVLFYMLVMFFLNDLTLILCWITLLMSILGILSKFNQLKFLLSWSSLIDSSLIVFCGFYKLSLMFFYYMIYSAVLFLMLKSVSSISSGLLKFFNKNKNLNFSISLGFLFIVVMGLPPMLGFLYKFHFFYILSSYHGGLLKKVLLLYMVLVGVFMQSLSYFFFFLQISKEVLWGKIFFSHFKKSMMFVMLKLVPIFFFMV